jgi:hypothetical protein
VVVGRGDGPAEQRVAGLRHPGAVPPNVGHERGLCRIAALALSRPRSSEPAPRFGADAMDDAAGQEGQDWLLATGDLRPAAHPNTQGVMRVRDTEADLAGDLIAARLREACAGYTTKLSGAEVAARAEGSMSAMSRSVGPPICVAIGPIAWRQSTRKSGTGRRLLRPAVLRRSAGSECGPAHEWLLRFKK